MAKDAAAGSARRSWGDWRERLDLLAQPAKSSGGIPAAWRSKSSGTASESRRRRTAAQLPPLRRRGFFPGTGKNYLQLAR